MEENTSKTEERCLAGKNGKGLSAPVKVESAKKTELITCLQRNEKVGSKKSNRIQAKKVKIIQTAKKRKKRRQRVTNEVPQYEVMVCMSVCVSACFLFNETVAQWSEEDVEADSFASLYLLNRQGKEG